MSKSFAMKVEKLSATKENHSLYRILRYIEVRYIEVPLQIVFIVSRSANLLEQKNVFTREKS